MITGISVTYIHTPNRALADWYRDMLGLSCVYDDGHWVEFSSECTTRFALDITGPDPSPVEKQSIVISFSVDDIHATVQNLHQKGVLFFPDHEHTIFDVGPSLVATFQDPEGNWLQLSEKKKN